MLSKFNEYNYIIDVHVANEQPPENGFPVIIVLDGTCYSKMMFEVMNSQTRMQRMRIMLLSFQLR